VSEKTLSEVEWKSFAKAQKLDDPKVASKDTKALHEAVLDAVQMLGKKDEGKPDEMLAALDEFADVLTKQVAANAKRKDKDGKALKDTKDVKDQLYKMLSAVDKLRKELNTAKSKKEEAEADDDEESPALLTTKMLPLIREVRKGQLVLQSLIALAGKETVVLLSRKPISPARGKLLKEQMTNPSGLKFVRGECMLEANALTFVVQSSATGLAKKLKAALLAQTELRLKVRVRGEDPEDIDEDDGGDEETAAGAPGGPQGSNKPPGPPDAAKLAFAKRLLKLKVEVDKAVTRGDARSDQLLAVLASARQKVQDGNTAAGDDELTALEKLLEGTAGAGANDPVSEKSVNPKAAFDARLKALMPDIQKAIVGPPPNADVKRLLGSMGFHAKKGDFGDAHAVLDEIEGSLRRIAASTASAATETTVGTGRPVRRPVGAMSPRAAFTASRLLWAQTRDKIRAELRRLEAEVLAECKDEPDFEDIKANSGVLYSLLDHLDERLIDKLDDALNARNAEERRKLNEEALEIVNEYLEFVRDSELLHDIDDNGFLAVPVKSLLDERLADLADRLGQAVAV